MKKILFYLLILSAVSITIYSGCDSPTNVRLDEKVMPAKDISYINNLHEVFMAKCATAECHGDETKAGGLSLTTYSNTTFDPTMVAPHFPDQSRLVWTIDPKFSSATPMPPPFTEYRPLTNEQVRGIRTWIEEGAKDN